MYLEFDRVTDELRVLLDDLLDLFLVDVLGLIFLQVEDDLGTATKGLTMIRSDRERTTSGRLKRVITAIKMRTTICVHDTMNGLNNHLKILINVFCYV